MELPPGLTQRIDAQLYRQIARLLDCLEAGDASITLQQRIDALTDVASLMELSATLQNKHAGESECGV